ncbi:MAG: 3-methyl-2-oxobutanoate hydroxymethyltransferase [Acidobacteria bacterium]|nr:3-methyl-2-oxobutanoate hydroxymethyltransferase [Acidobacteriota bacterium]
MDKITVPSLMDRKARSEKITALTAYDYPTARLIDEAGVDVILVGDSLGMVVLGRSSTLPVTLEEMLHHTKAVTAGVKRALVVADMPFGTYHTSQEKALENAVRFLKEAAAEAVKVEGGERRQRLIRKLVDAEIPVMGHVGLTPQSLHRLGGYKVQGKTREAARALVSDALAVEAAGAFAVVLECIPLEVAQEITGRLGIPTIGIGAGPHCDGQILVTHDLLGLSFNSHPKFVRKYADLASTMGGAFRRYAEDVRGGHFPTAEESYHYAFQPQVVRK